MQLGIILMAKQDGHAAATALMEAILLNPEFTHAHYSLGSVQYALGNLKAAVQSYRRALELQPHFPDARYRLALVLKLTNRDQEAAQLMEEAAAGGGEGRSEEMIRFSARGRRRSSRTGEFGIAAARACAALRG